MPTPTPTPDPYRQFLIDNPDASEGFDENDFRLAESHLERNGFPDPELYEAFNAKIKLENYLELDPSNPQHRRIIDMNWSDVSDRLYHGGQAQCTIGQSALAERIPDEKDREDVYKGLWYPLGIWYYKPSTEWPEKPRDGRAEYDDGQRNVTWTEENLQDIPLFAPKVMDAYNKYVQIPDNLLEDLMLYEQGALEWEGSSLQVFWEEAREDWSKRAFFFPYNIFESEFPASIDANSKYSDITREDREVDLSRFIHSLVTVMYSGDNADIGGILSKSVGCVFFDQRAPYDHGAEGHPTHGEAAVPIPIKILDEIRNNPERYGTPIIGPAQSIGWVPNLEAASKDGDDIPFVYFVKSDEINYLHIDEDYDIDKEIQKYPDHIKITVRRIE